MNSEHGANYRERARSLHIWKKWLLRFWTQSIRNPGRTEINRKKKKKGFDLVDQKGTVANRPINGVNSQPLP